MHFTKKEKINLLENSISGIVFLMMFIYGFAKINQFSGAIEVEKTLPELTGMELMWAFYGYSHPLALTIGLFEIVGGGLLLFKRTRILGCLLTTTILINIIIQDIAFEVNQGALIAAIIYQALILIILLMNKTRLIAAFKVLTQDTKTTESLKKKIIKFILVMLLVVTLFFFQHYLTSFLSYLL
ncbi:MAG: hypothetical protein COB15_10095 [Flavobacteriales bacterium]|nr:MAG: hypothetical protein COB15_10095 [Flavobacteriales bacterium]